MRAARRYWATAGLGAGLAGLAVVLARPVLLVGAAGIGAWLVVRGYDFYRALARTETGLEIEQTVSPSRVNTGDPVTVTVSVSLDEPAPVALSIAASPPPAARGTTEADRTIEIRPGDRSAEASFVASLPTAGVFEFAPATITATDRFGLLAESIRAGPTASLVVEPNSPRSLHVGEGGDRIAAAFGEHRAGRRGSGIDPVELREYVPGDAATRIDWKATARLNHPHVREYEVETDRQTVLLVDQRAAMDVGTAGETKLDYVRQVALAFLERARELDDPIGCYAVGDEGVTIERAPDATDDTYAVLRRRLQGLEPVGRPPSGTRPDRAGRPPDEARRTAARLRGDESAFATALRPFYAAATPYVRRLEGEPLFGAARTYLGRLRGALWTVVFTDDTDRAEVRETVKLARRGDDHVIVFLTPTALFEPAGLADVDEAYDRYVTFESFRRELAGLDRVSAFEVAPGDRLAAVLSAGRGARERRVAGGR